MDGAGRIDDSTRIVRLRSAVVETPELARFPARTITRLAANKRKYFEGQYSKSMVGRVVIAGERGDKRRRTSETTTKTTLFSRGTFSRASRWISQHALSPKRVKPA